jgi:broad specificity phosphatase PhoE
MFYLVRHGETEWNAKMLIQGHTDIPLNEKGKIQANTVAKKLNQVKFDKAFSSDLLRAKQTAEILALEHNLSIETTQALRERNFGPLEGGHRERLREIDIAIKHLSKAEKYSYKHDGLVESDEELMNRFITLIREIAVANPNKTILLTSHGGIIRAFLMRIDPENYPGEWFNISNLAYVKFATDGVDFEIKETSGIGKLK